MLSFDPPDLRNRLAKAIDTWKAHIPLGWEFDVSYDIVDVSNPNFDPAEYEDMTISEGTEFMLSLPRWEDEVRVSYGEFIELSKELKNAVLRRNLECWTENRLLVRVSPVSEAAEQYLYRTLPEPKSEDERREQLALIEQRKRTATLLKQTPDPREVESEEHIDEEAIAAYLEASRQERELSDRVDKRIRRYCSVRVRLGEREVTCALVEGFTLFGASVAAKGEYDRYSPPVLNDDLFVEVQSDGAVSEEEARQLLEAYMFELSSSLGIDLEVSPRPTIIAEDDFDLYEGGTSLSEPRLRPLLLGKGMAELLELYNRAVATSDREIQVLYFTKVVEFVSRTVISMRATETIRTKLLSPRSLQPDAAFVAELQALIEEQRNFQKDREAIKQTMITCCEASELLRSAPPFLETLRDASSTRSRKEKESALAALGSSLYATRNLVAHAKANYEPTGEECPKEQLNQFAECAKLAAQQVIRWYHSRPEEVRVT